MGQIVSDDFNRANSTGLGANWTASVANYNVTSNQAVSNATSGDHLVVYSGAAWTGGNDQYTEVTAITKPSPQDCGPVVRGSTSALTMYLLEINSPDASVALGASMTCQMYKVVSSTFTAVGSSAAYVVSSGDVLRLEINGTSLTAKLNGVTKHGPSTDSGIASGKPGFYNFNSSGVVFDDFAAGDFSSSVIFIPRPALQPLNSFQIVSV
jgi:hypothetical protein